MRTKTINVTEMDISNGSPNDDCNCPVALATRKAFKKGEGFVKVNEGYIFIGKHIKVRMPTDVSIFVSCFDCEKPVQPFSFELEY